MQVRKILINGESFGIHRGKINDNFLEIWNVILQPEDVLVRGNNSPYTPTNPYNPATKGYADSLQTNWQSVYNPQGINSDVFLRSNHTGNMPGENITQDENHRLVSDTEKLYWNAKEQAIGPKGTAFNKDFGTVTNTVASGDHIHSTYEPKNVNIQSHIATTGNAHSMVKADIGLSNVDNTADVNKPVSTAQQTELNKKVPISNAIYVSFNPTLGNPSYLEGRLFYDQEHHALSYYTNQPDVLINLGKEIVIDVFNNTGSIIPNGTPVRFPDGIDAGTKRPYVEPAIASDFENGFVVGITTHDIENNQTGIITRSGIVHGVDTSSFAGGQILYLSDTVAGEFVTTPPDLITICGSVIFSNVEGSILVDIISNYALPNTYATIENVATPPTLTTSYQTITGWGTSDSIIDTANTTTGVLTPVGGTGKYRVTGNLTASFDGSATGTRTITLQVWDNTNSVSLYETTISVPKDATQGSRSFSKLINVVALNDYVLRIKADTTFTNLSFDNISFDIVGVNAR